jgi:hypothetical protein
MISQVTFKSAVISAGYRILKVLGYGNTALTADECSPAGIDSSPVKNMVAVYSETEEAGDRILIGYFNKNVLAAPGEIRLFSLNPGNGNLSFYAWLKNNGTMELGGNENNIVRYTPLESGLNEQDNLINTELEKIAIAIGLLGGSYVPGTISTDISTSKINEIKCI